MAAMSNYLENKLIDALFRGVSFTPPATLYAAAFTANPTAAGGGTEVASGGYSRVAIPCSAANWAATQAAGSTAATSSGTSGATSNNATMSFPTPTASQGTVTGTALYDAATGGNLIFFGPLTTPLAIGPSNPLTFPAGQYGITLS